MCTSKLSLISVAFQENLYTRGATPETAVQGLFSFTVNATKMILQGSWLYHVFMTRSGFLSKLEFII